MAVPVWPSDLPQRVQRESYSQGFGDGRLRTPMEAGLPKVRRRFSTSGKPVTVTLDERIDAFARLERFFEEDTKGGALPFLMPDQTLDGASLVDQAGNSLTDENGNSLVAASYWLVMFGESLPTLQDRGGGWFRATFPLIRLP